MINLSGHATATDVYGSTSALTAIAAVAVVARLYARIFVADRAGSDDALITFALAFSIAMGVSICKQTDYGMTRHIWTVSMEELESVAYWFWACYWLFVSPILEIRRFLMLTAGISSYYCALFCTKMSILLQYIRIFPHTRLRKCCFVMIAIVTLWSIWAVFSSIFTCIPVQKFWKVPMLVTPGCMPRLSVWYSNAAVNIASDIAILCIPLPYINSLEVPRKQKCLLLGVFGVGFFTCLVSVLRLVYIYPISTSPDLTWHNALANIWSCVEVNVGILCSCAPTLKGIFQRSLPKIISSIRSFSSRSQSSTSQSQSLSNEKAGLVRKSRSRLGALWPSRLTSSTTSSSDRTLYQSYGGEEALQNDMTKQIEVMTSVNQVSEPMEPDEVVVFYPPHCRQSSVPVGKNVTVIEAGTSTRNVNGPGRNFGRGEEGLDSSEKELHRALGVV